MCTHAFSYVYMLVVCWDKHLSWLSWEFSYMPPYTHSCMHTSIKTYIHRHTGIHVCRHTYTHALILSWLNILRSGKFRSALCCSCSVWMYDCQYAYGHHKYQRDAVPLVGQCCPCAETCCCPQDVSSQGQDTSTPGSLQFNAVVWQHWLLGLQHNIPGPRHVIPSHHPAGSNWLCTSHWLTRCCLYSR